MHLINLLVIRVELMVWGKEFFFLPFVLQQFHHISHWLSAVLHDSFVQIFQCHGLPGTELGAGDMGGEGWGQGVGIRQAESCPYWSRYILGVDLSFLPHSASSRNSVHRTHFPA